MEYFYFIQNYKKTILFELIFCIRICECSKLVDTIMYILKVFNVKILFPINYTLRGVLSLFSDDNNYYTCAQAKNLVHISTIYRVNVILST